MTIAEYLASEQAREDVRVAVHAMATSKTSTFCGGLEDHWVESTHLEAWLRVAYFRFGGKAFLVSAYYRPDGDLYVVTDLGEGVRALRLRTGMIHGAAVNCAKPMRAALMDKPAVGWIAGLDGDMELDGVKPEHLPDAICRVMLASLRVAQS